MFRRWLPKIGPLCLALSTATGALADPPVFVIEDQTKLLQLRSAIAEVIVGNASIVGVTVLHNDMLALTGKTHGGTNLIVRDASGEVLMDTMLYVRPADGPVVTVRRGAALSKYTCNETCQLMVFESMDIGSVGKAVDAKGVSRTNDQDGSLYPCDSPNQIAGDGKSCGGRSAWSKPGGRIGHP